MASQTPPPPSLLLPQKLECETQTDGVSYGSSSVGIQAAQWDVDGCCSDAAVMAIVDCRCRDSLRVCVPAARACVLGPLTRCCVAEARIPKLQMARGQPASPVAAMFHWRVLEFKRMRTERDQLPPPPLLLLLLRQ